MLDLKELGEAIERADISGMRACVASAQRIAKHLDADSIDILGGIAPFAGASSPLSEATGLGIFGDVSSREIERLTQFYLERATAHRILVSSLAAISLPALLAQAGYRPCEHQNVLAGAIATLACARDPRIVESRDARAWGRASAEGFMAPEPPAERDVLVGTIIASIPTVTTLEARDDGQIVATAAMDVQGDLGGLFAGSTAIAARHRGWHAATIRDRLARARERGARFVRTSAAVGSASERHFRRAGFEVLYTRTVWEFPCANVSISNNYQRQLL